MSDLNPQLAYMYSLERFGIKPGLDTISRLLAALGHPERQFRSIHITGTNGKGSTAALIASILQASGQRVGLYTSPHLLRFNERIQVNSEQIFDSDLSHLIQTVRTAANSHNLQPTFFEFTTALAFLYFSLKSLDIAIIEVGLGGRFDATNVIMPDLAIITNVGWDHADIIGPQLTDIAAEKAGIIKPGIPVITAETDPKILSYFREICAAQSAQLLTVSEHLSARAIASNWRYQTIQISGQISDQFNLPLLGAHQITNALTAILSVLTLSSVAQNISSILQPGLAQVVWPGRLQVLSEHPLVLIDGAHNEPGLKALDNFLDQNMPTGDVIVLGIKQGKNTLASFQPIISRFKHVITTEGTYQPLSAHNLADSLRAFHTNVQAIPNSAQALQTAHNLLPQTGRLLVTGSLYLLPAALSSI